jgi:hypothetical protein
MLEREINVRVRYRSKCKVLGYTTRLVGIVVRARPIAEVGTKIQGRDTDVLWKLSQLRVSISPVGRTPKLTRRDRRVLLRLAKKYLKIEYRKLLEEAGM